MKKFASFQSADNSTDDLEVRVTLLENDVTVLQDEVEEMETDINQLDYEILFVEGNVAENSYDIDGKLDHLLEHYKTLCHSFLMYEIKT